MKSFYKQFSDDLNVAALYADALMKLMPWALWDIRTGEPTTESQVLEAKQVLDQVSLLGWIQTHGLLHSYIDLMEMSSTPEKALTIADRLRGLVPDAGHLRHIPSPESIYSLFKFYFSWNTNQRLLGLDLDIMCGDYQRAIAASSEAVLADERFVAREGRSLYIENHNFETDTTKRWISGFDDFQLIHIE